MNAVDYNLEMAHEMQRAKKLVKMSELDASITEFDVRGRLYNLANQLAPQAREADLKIMRERIEPVVGEKGLDIAAGGGFLTLPLAKMVSGLGEMYALDPSSEMLNAIEKHELANINTIVGDPNYDAMSVISNGSIDFVTSFGGLHHVGDQQEMFNQVARVLRPGGRFVAGDVGAGTDLARHFDTFVAEKCLTGHQAQWLGEEQIERMVRELDLDVVYCEIVPLTWVFKDRATLALFFRGFHAYDLPDDEIVQDLEDALGVTEHEGELHLNWPMLIFKLEKRRARPLSAKRVES